MDPTGEGGPPARVTLSRSVILAAAVTLIDRDGVDALTMRALGQSIGFEAMSLYRYTTGRSDVLDGVVDLVMDEVTVPTSDHGPTSAGSPEWEEELRTIARSFRDVTLAHPHVVPLLVTRSLVLPLPARPTGVLRPVEDFLALSLRAGFCDGDLMHLYRCFWGFLYGHALTELQTVVADPAQRAGSFRLGSHRPPATAFPHLRSLADDLTRYDGAAELERGMDTLLAGLHATLHPQHSPLPLAPRSPPGARTAAAASGSAP